MSNEPKTPSPVDSGAQALEEALHSSFAIVKWVMVILFGAFLVSGIFKVEPQEKAIKLLLGKPVGEGDQVLIGSGTHWAWPYPINQIVKIPPVGPSIPLWTVTRLPATATSFTPRRR